MAKLPLLEGFLRCDRYFGSCTKDMLSTLNDVSDAPVNVVLAEATMRMLFNTMFESNTDCSGAISIVTFGYEINRIRYNRFSTTEVH